jgi:peptidoglycan-N-acetylglucosamine deacetylase
MTGVWKASKARCFQFVGDVTCHVQTSQKIVALSFDNGPTPGGVGAVKLADRFSTRLTNSV